MRGRGRSGGGNAGAAWGKLRLSLRADPAPRDRGLRRAGGEGAQRGPGGFNGGGARVGLAPPPPRARGEAPPPRLRDARGPPASRSGVRSGDFVII